MCVGTSHKHYISKSITVLIAVFMVTGVVASTAFATKKKDNEKLSKEQRRREKAIQREMESPYKKWISGPISYIITPQERAAFKKLTTDEERDNFIEEFWNRRNPNPGSADNGYKEEFYRRIAYANEHFASGWPGWKTDRGRIYIMYGPPDDREEHPTGGIVDMNPNELPYSGADVTTQMTTYPYEDWTYHYIPGIGEHVVLEFVDTTGTGEYHLTMNPCEKDALAHTPGDLTGCRGNVAIGPIWNPQEILDPSMVAPGSMVTTNFLLQSQGMDMFNRLNLYAKIFQPPAVKFNDLKAVVTSRLTAQLLPFSVRTDFFKVTDETVLTPITIQVPNRAMQFEDKEGVMHAVLDIYGQLSTLGGRIANTFDDGVVMDVPDHDFQNYVKQKSIYQKVVYLRPGRYKLSVVVKDDRSGHMGSTAIGIVVPRFDDDKLSNSSLVLADLIQPLPTSEVGSVMFGIGGTKVRPSVNQIFTPSQNLGIYMQVYNLGVDPKTHRPSADIQYRILKEGRAILNQTETSAAVKHAGEQLTLEKMLPVRLLQPGRYTVQIKVTDNIKKQTDTQSANFQVQ